MPHAAKSRIDDVFDEAFLGSLQRLRLLAKRLVRGRSAGTQRSRHLGDGLEFADHRAYASGDDIRFIDWPYYARMEKLLLRLFHQHRESDVAILLDASASMAPGGRLETFHYALRAAAALAYVAMTSLDRVTVWPFATELRPELRIGRSSDQILPLLQYLADIEPGGHTHLARCVEAFSRRGLGPASVFVLSDLLDCGDDLSDALQRLRQRPGDLVVLHVCQADRPDPAWRGPVLLRDAETNQPVSLDVTDQVIDAYRRRQAVFVDGCRRMCVARGAVYVAAPTDQPFERLILRTLRQTGVLEGS